MTAVSPSTRSAASSLQKAAASTTGHHRRGNSSNAATVTPAAGKNTSPDALTRFTSETIPVPAACTAAITANSTTAPAASRHRVRAPAAG